MKVLIISDTHRHANDYFKLLKKIAPMDLVIHCGDVEGQETELEAVTEEISHCSIAMVAGNNDVFSDLRKELTIELGGHRIWVTHGHNYYVSMGNEFIKQEAKARGYDIVLYGHTHRPVIDDRDAEIIAVNPGSISYPRQEGRLPSYAVMTIEEDGSVHFAICYIGQGFYSGS
jgi:putative phosphoesterase